MIIVGIIIGIVIGSISLYYYFKPRLNKIEELNQDIEQYNTEQEQIKRELELSVSVLGQQKQDLENTLETLSKNREFILEALDESFDKTLNRKAQEVQDSISEYEIEYLKILEDKAKSIQKTYEEENQKIEQLKTIVSNYQKIVKSAVEANKRIEEEKDFRAFYMLQLLPEDLKEIAVLRSITSELRNPEPLNKVIWKYYYEKPYTDLVGRVVGNKTICGIYKITNMLNQKCYIGQTTDMAARFKQHIKRGLGADTPTNNKLYPAMLQDGVENFSFEIIENCPKEQLNEKEKFWQDYFCAKEYGYSIK